MGKIKTTLLGLMATVFLLIICKYIGVLSIKYIPLDYSKFSDTTLDKILIGIIMLLFILFAIIAFYLFGKAVQCIKLK